MDYCIAIDLVTATIPCAEHLDFCNRKPWRPASTPLSVPVNLDLHPDFALYLLLTTLGDSYGKITTMDIGDLFHCPTAWDIILWEARKIARKSIRIPYYFSDNIIIYTRSIFFLLEEL